MGTWEWAAGKIKWVPGIGQQGHESGDLGLGSRDKKVSTWEWAAGTRKWVPGSGQPGH